MLYIAVRVTPPEKIMYKLFDQLRRIYDIFSIHFLVLNKYIELK